MTTHDTDHPQEIDHAEENYGVDSEGDEVAQEQAAEAEEAEPVIDDDDLDHTDRPPDADDIETEGLVDPDTDVADEAAAFGGSDTEATEDEHAIALGPVDDEAATDAEAPPDTVVTGTMGAEPVDDDDLAEEPVIVELDETEVEVLDEPSEDVDTDVDTDDGDESVLLTESAPGSVLPPGEAEAEAVGSEEAAAAESDEAFPVPEPSAMALLEPVGPDAPIDPGTGTYGERWSAIQGGFVDDPQRTVESAGALVTEMWQELERSIAAQRDALDSAWGTGSSTDDLRTAFRAYRDMFNRLTALLSETQPEG